MFVPVNCIFCREVLALKNSDIVLCVEISVNKMIWSSTNVGFMCVNIDTAVNTSRIIEGHIIM